MNFHLLSHLNANFHSVNEPGTKKGNRTYWSVIMIDNLQTAFGIVHGIKACHVCVS